MTVGQCFNTNTKSKPAPCGTPSFPEGNAMHGNFSPASSGLYRSWGGIIHKIYLKPSMGDSTLHSVSVVAVVNAHQGAQLQMHCAKRCDVRTVLNSMVCHNDPVRHFSCGTAILLRVEVLGNSCTRDLALTGAGGVVPVIVYQCSCTKHGYHISLA